MAAATALVDAPAHVPPARTYDFDISHDPLLTPDLHLGLLELRKRAPEIFFTPRYGGHWIAQGHEAVFEITHDTELFSSWQGLRQMIPIGIDPPQHESYRRVLLQAFSPRTVTAMTATIRAMSTELIDAVARRGRCEFVREVSEPMPVTVFMKMLGLPLEMMAPLRSLIITALEEGDPVKREATFDAQLEMLDPIIHARMANPQDDMLSRIATADLDGRRPTFDEMQRYLLLLANAGLDTVVNAMSFAVRHLAVDQGLQDRVRADPGLVPDLLEEFLRRYAVSSIGRRVTRDTVFRGVSLRAGERFILLLPAANLDETVYDHPGEVQLNREAPPVTFGTGVHRCLGSHLARLELRILLTDWMTRIPSFRLDPDSPPKTHAGLVYTVDQLDLVWDGSQAAGPG